MPIPVRLLLRVVAVIVFAFLASLVVSALGQPAATVPVARPAGGHGVVGISGAPASAVSVQAGRMIHLHAPSTDDWLAVVRKN